jgi:hypothetical protein
LKIIPCKKNKKNSFTFLWHVRKSISPFKFSSDLNLVLGNEAKINPPGFSCGKSYATIEELLEDDVDLIT